MSVSNIRKLLIVAVTLITLIACSPTGENSAPVLPTVISPANEQHPSVPVTGSLCENEFLPIKQGASWVYFNAGGPNGDFAYTDTITETTSNSFVLTSQFPTMTLSQAWHCSPEGLIAQQLGGGTTASVSMQNMIVDFKTLHVSGVSLPVQITPGMTWQYEISLEGSVAMPGEETQSPGTFSLTMQELGRETVTVPAGTFDAVKLQATFNARFNVDFQGSPVPYTVNGSSIIWYAPNVGFVKSIENIDFSGTPFESTTELQTYNIP